MHRVEWDELIAAEMAKSRSMVAAHTYRGRKWNTQCSPVVLGCDDGRDYVVKGAQTGKAVVNEQVVGRLGGLINAPIPSVQIVLVPTELVTIEPEISHVYHGFAHGSPIQENCTDKRWLAHTDVSEKEARFAALAVLYGWTSANDPQMIYSLDKPQLVWSVDHGNFFPGGPDWSVTQLHTTEAACVLANISAVCKTQHIQETLDVLAEVKPEQIAAAVAAPPPTWQITTEERRELAMMIERRRTELLDWNP